MIQSAALSTRLQLHLAAGWDSPALVLREVEQLVQRSADVQLQAAAGPGVVLSWI